MTDLEVLLEKYPETEVVDVVQELDEVEFREQKKKMTERQIKGGAIGVAWMSDEEVVLTHRTKPFPGWALPGGRVEEDESFSDAFIRELEEETSVKAVINHLLLVERKIFVAPDGEEAPILLAVFNAEALNNQKAVNTEGANFEGLEIATYHKDKLPEKMILNDRRKIELAAEFMAINR